MRFPLTAALVVFAVGCGDQAAMISEPVVSNTIMVPGNDPIVPICPPEPWCLAPIDREVLDLYNRNNTLSQEGDGTSTLNFHGEMEYQAASNANNNLTRIWSAYEMEADEAIRHLNAYISDISRGVAQGTISQCAAGQLIERASWIIGLIEESAVNGFTPDMLATRPPYDCQLSPVTPSGSASASAGATLTWTDPWGFQTYYEVQLPSGAFAITTSASFNDPTANTPSTSYTYSVRQCAPQFGCGAWTSVTVTVPVTGGGGGEEPPPAGCVHDNRNKTFTPTPGVKKCSDKDIKIGHPVKS